MAQTQPAKVNVTQQNVAAGTSRITLPPIVNPKRPQSNELIHATSHAAVIFAKRKSQRTAHRQISAVALTNANCTTRSFMLAAKSDLKSKEECRQSLQKQQQKQAYPLQTSQSFNEQSEIIINTTSNNKNTTTASNRASASSSYSRITLNDLLDQSAANSGAPWSHRSSSIQFTSNHLLKLPVIES